MMATFGIDAQMSGFLCHLLRRRDHGPGHLNSFRCICSAQAYPGSPACLVGLAVVCIVETLGWYGWPFTHQLGWFVSQRGGTLLSVVPAC